MTKKLFLYVFLACMGFGIVIVSQRSDAKVFIDITSPAARRIPIAIFDLEGPFGKDISEIIREDLIFSGLFMYIDKASYVEEPGQEFDPNNWKPLGIEAVVKGRSELQGDLNVTISLYDTFSNEIIFTKQYQSQSELLRPLSHSISNDIYAALSGEIGVFRTKIAFVGEEKGDKSVYLMDYDGQRIKKLGLRGNMVLSPHWSKDGTKIIYSADRGRQWGIYMLNFLKMSEQSVFISEGVNIAGDLFPNGESFVFSSTMKGTPDIYRISLRGGEAKRLTSGYGIEVSPAVSPDGERIAFVSDRGGSPQIYVMSADGTNSHRVTYEGSYNTSPSWSPKGDKIIFVSLRGGKNQVCTINPDGSELVQLTVNGNNEDPSFSPDGRFITFTSDRDRTKGVYIMRANGEAQQKVTPHGLKGYGPRWSPL